MCNMEVGQPFYTDDKITVNVLKFCTLKFLTKRPIQTADPDQTASKGSGSSLFAIPQSVLRNKGIKMKI